jgi:signal transduction histidine kinase
MRERALLIDGTLAVKPGRHRGVDVRLEVAAPVAVQAVGVEG